jgi:hypothetical protein
MHERGEAAEVLAQQGMLRCTHFGESSDFVFVIFSSNNN